jgi:hypothetical protein
MTCGRIELVVNIVDNGAMMETTSVKRTTLSPNGGEKAKNRHLL